MLSKLLINYEETASVILFCIGFSTMLLNKNLIKKIIGMDIMDTAVYLFLASQGYIKGRTVPIVVDGIQSVEAYINPIPAGLVLTGIVVSVSVSALMLALCERLQEKNLVRELVMRPGYISVAMRGAEQETELVKCGLRQLERRFPQCVQVREK